MDSIQTEYEGYLFRSRLEAKWAVFFDAIGIRWEYEPVGLVLSDGTNYLPDFYLTDLRCFFEVKGNYVKGTDKEKEAIKRISDGMKTDAWAGIIAFGDPLDDDLTIFCQETDENGGGSYESKVTIGYRPGTVEPYLFSLEDSRPRYFFTSFMNFNDQIPMETERHGTYRYNDFVTPHIKEARRMARQARFEFGETPKIRGCTR